MSLISAGSISLDSPFKFFINVCVLVFYENQRKYSISFFCLYFPIKRDSVTRFVLQVFFMNHLPPSSLGAISIY
jgi:hypothetical protein